MTEKIISLYIAMAGLGATIFIGIVVKEFYRKALKKRISFKFLIYLGIIAIAFFSYLGMSWELVKSLIISIILALITLEMLVYSDELDEKLGL